MKIGIDNALGIHPQALALRAARTQVLARNIANADTPEFKARDVDFHQVLTTLTKADSGKSMGWVPANALRTTHHQHLTHNHGNATHALIENDELQYRVPLMPSLDGNTVDVQLEQTTFAENSVQFLTSLRILNGRFKGMLTAIKGE